MIAYPPEIEVGDRQQTVFSGVVLSGWMALLVALKRDSEMRSSVSATPEVTLQCKT